MDIDMSLLRGELARRALAQWRLAGLLGTKPSTLSDWLRGARPAPDDLRHRIESVLNLRRGALRVATAVQSNPKRAP